jgi:hypothetical protein
VGDHGFKLVLSYNYNTSLRGSIDKMQPKHGEVTELLLPFYHLPLTFRPFIHLG